MTTELEPAIQAEYEAVLNAPDRQERQAHLDRLVELLREKAGANSRLNP